MTNDYVKIFIELAYHKLYFYILFISIGKYIFKIFFS